MGFILKLMGMPGAFLLPRSLSFFVLHRFDLSTEAFVWRRQKHLWNQNQLCPFFIPLLIYSFTILFSLASKPEMANGNQISLTYPENDSAPRNLIKKIGNLSSSPNLEEMVPPGLAFLFGKNRQGSWILSHIFWCCSYCQGFSSFTVPAIDLYI